MTVDTAVPVFHSPGGVDLRRSEVTPATTDRKELPNRIAESMAAGTSWTRIGRAAARARRCRGVTSARPPLHRATGLLQTGGAKTGPARARPRIPTRLRLRDPPGARPTRPRTRSSRSRTESRPRKRGGKGPVEKPPCAGGSSETRPPSLPGCERSTDSSLGSRTGGDERRTEAQGHRSTLPAMRVMVAPPTQTVPSASCSICTRPLRPNRVP